jgi:hypothetical protein
MRLPSLQTDPADADNPQELTAFWPGFLVWRVGDRTDGTKTLAVASLVPGGTGHEQTIVS